MLHFVAYNSHLSGIATNGKQFTQTKQSKQWNWVCKCFYCIVAFQKKKGCSHTVLLIRIEFDHRKILIFYYISIKCNQLKKKKAKLWPPFNDLNIYCMRYRKQRSYKRLLFHLKMITGPVQSPTSETFTRQSPFFPCENVQASSSQGQYINIHPVFIKSVCMNQTIRFYEVSNGANPPPPLSDSVFVSHIPAYLHRFNTQSTSNWSQFNLSCFRANRFNQFCFSAAEWFHKATFLQLFCTALVLSACFSYSASCLFDIFISCRDGEQEWELASTSAHWTRLSDLTGSTAGYW